jgi:hypothetical protein
MALIELQRNPSPRDLAWFGVALLIACGVAGAVLRFRFDLGLAAWVVWGAGSSICALYYAAPPLRRTLFVGWMILVYPIGWIVSHTALVLIYYLVLTPTGLLRRLFGRDPMTRRLERDSPSYWIRRPPSAGPQRYFKQY